MIYLPITVSVRRRKTLEDAGATLVLFGNDIVDTEREARRVAAEQGVLYISPYNDLQVTCHATNAILSCSTRGVSILKRLLKPRKGASGLVHCR